MFLDGADVLTGIASLQRGKGSEVPDTFSRTGVFPAALNKYNSLGRHLAKLENSSRQVLEFQVIPQEGRRLG
jgi:hypothetical protein